MFKWKRNSKSQSF